MPALQFSTAMLANLLNGSQPESGAKGADNAGKNAGKDQFSSLLDVVGNISDTPNGTAKDASKKDGDKTPVAAAVDVPAPIKPARSGADKKADKVDNDNKADNAAKPAAKAKDDADNDKQKPDVANDVDDKAPIQKSTDQKILKADKPAQASDNKVAASDEVDELKEKISDRVDSLSELMNIIAQLLAGAGAVTAPAEVAAAVNAAGNDVAAAAATKAVPNPFAVFADLTKNLAQLQKFLQAANQQDTPLTDEQNATLTAINNALASDLEALKGLLPLAGGDNKQSLLDILQAQQDALPQATTADTQLAQANTADVKSLLQDDIALIKNALQKFKALSEAAPEKKEVASQPVIQPLTTDSQNKQASPLDNRNNNIPASNVIVLPVAVQADAQQTQQNQQLQNNQLAFTASIHTQSQGAETETNSGGNTGQGGGNSQPQITVGGIGATQAGATDKAAGSQFSNLLHRAAQTPVTEQIAFQIKTAVNTGNSKISIQLNPEELGKLDITLDVDSKGRTGVTVTADNKQTLDLLQRDSQGLQRALADAGLKTDAGSLSFNLRGGEREGQGSQNQSQAASQYQKSQPDDVQGEMNIATIAAVTRSYTINLPDGLDIKI